MRIFFLIALVETALKSLVFFRQQPTFPVAIAMAVLNRRRERSAQTEHRGRQLYYWLCAR